MPKIEVSAARLRKVAAVLGAEADKLGHGTPERDAAERVLLNDERMLAAFIDWHTRRPQDAG